MSKEEKNINSIAIILDTNIFGKPSKYNFNGLNITSFFNSVKGYSNIDIFIPSIVYRELKKHIKETIDKDKKIEMSKYFKENKPIDLFDNIYINATKKLDTILEKYNVKSIDCDNYIDIKEVNNWYFDRKEPFEEKVEKSKEFPDAMIISAIKNYFIDKNYTKVYVISNDNGFNEGIKRETNFLTFGDINSVRNEIFGYDINEIYKIRDYLSKNLNIFNIPSKYLFNSSDSSDVIDIDEINDIEIGDIDILDNDEGNNIITVEVKIDAKITGEFCIIDPYNSVYEKVDSEYSYIECREAKEINIKDESIYIEVVKDKNNSIINAKLIDDVNEIDILEYLNQMELVYDKSE